jgi:hypothetical protein
MRRCDQDLHRFRRWIAFSVLVFGGFILKIIGFKYVIFMTLNLSVTPSRSS